MNQKKEASYDLKKGAFDVKVELAEMLNGGAIIEVTSPEEAKIAEEAGALAVMALEPAIKDVQGKGGVARMSDLDLIKQIQEAVSIPVMAKCRIGHIAEAQILEALFVDFIDESELLTPADEENHIDKHAFRIPFICGCTDLGEALRRIGEGAALIRTKGEFETGNVAAAVKHMRAIRRDIRRLSIMDNTELMTESKKMGAPYRLVQDVAETGKLPVPNFAAGGIATPADAALLMQLGAESIFVGSDIFKSETPLKKVKAIVAAVNHFSDIEMLAKISRGQLSAMPSAEGRIIKDDQIMQQRGW